MGHIANHVKWDVDILKSAWRRVLPYLDALLEAIARSRRSGRDISTAAVGHASAVRDLKRRKDLRASTLEAICRELGLELRIAEPGSVPHEIAQTLELPEDCKVADAVRALEQMRKGMSDSLTALRRETEANLESFRRETIRHSVEILQEYRREDPDHLRNAPFHAVPYATEIRETGRPGEVEFVLASVGLSFRRSDIDGMAEWAHLVCTEAPENTQNVEAHERDLVVLDTMRPSTSKGNLIVLDVSSRELLRGSNFTYLTLHREGLSLRRLNWVADDSWGWYSEPLARPSGDGNVHPRRRLSPGEWVIGRVAGRARGDFRPSEQSLGPAKLETR